MSKEFEARFDLRVGVTLKRRFKKFCAEHNLKLSDAGRDAITQFLNHKNFVDSIIEQLQTPEFFDTFNAFYTKCPDKVRESFGDILGPAEEKLVKGTPPQLLRTLKVVTKKGQRALESYYK
jgi:hypothetical protein